MAPVLALALLAADPLPEGNAYVGGLVDRQRRREEVVNRYTYDVSEVQEELDGDGRRRGLETARYEVFHVKGRPVRKKVAEDGRPLPGDEQAREERRVREMVESIVKGRTAAEQPEVRLSEVLARYHFRTVGREELDERPTLAFEFAPRPGERKLDGDRFLRVLAGRIWVDEEERELVRAEIRSKEGVGLAWGLGPTLAALTLDMRFDRAEEALWLPSRVQVLAAGRLLPLKSFRVRLTLLYGRYRRFETETQERSKPRE